MQGVRAIHMFRLPFRFKHTCCGFAPPPLQAYDYFPCQHQLFYRGKGNSFWYEPIFKVSTFRLCTWQMSIRGVM